MMMTMMMMSPNEHRWFPAELGNVSYSTAEQEASLSYSSSDSESSNGSNASDTNVDGRQGRPRRYSEDISSPLSQEFSVIIKKHKERRAERKQKNAPPKPDPPTDRSEQNFDQYHRSQTQLEQDLVKSKLAEALELISSDGLVKSKLSEALELISTDGSTDETIHLLGMESSTPLISRFAMENYAIIDQVNFAPRDGNDQHDDRSMFYQAVEKSNNTLGDEGSVIHLVDARQEDQYPETEEQESRDGPPLQATFEPYLYSPGRPSFQPKATLNEIVRDDESMLPFSSVQNTKKRLGNYNALGLMRRRLHFPEEKSGGDNKPFDPDTNSIILSEDDTAASPLNRRILQRSMKKVEPTKSLDNASPQLSHRYRSFSFEDDVDELGPTEYDDEYDVDDDASCSLDSEEDGLMPLVECLSCFILS